MADDIYALYHLYILRWEKRSERLLHMEGVVDYVLTHFYRVTTHMQALIYIHIYIFRPTIQKNKLVASMHSRTQKWGNVPSGLSFIALQRLAFRVCVNTVPPLGSERGLLAARRLGSNECAFTRLEQRFKQALART